MGALIGPEVLHSPLPIVLELAACAGLVGLNVAEPPTASAPFGVKAQV
jgi:hypothetical protein